MNYYSKNVKGQLTSITLLVILISSLPVIIGCDSNSDFEFNSINLPEPDLKSNYSLEEALNSRRSVRQYTDEPVTISEISQLLWAAQGITLPDRGFRTAPSAGATFPIHIYLIASNVTGLDEGLFLYQPEQHSIAHISGKDKRSLLSQSAVRQGSFRGGACSIIIAAEYERTTDRYGERGIRYVHNEIGHVGQNIHLQVESLGLGTVILGSFNDSEVKKVLQLPDHIDPLYIMPVGRK